MRTLPRLGWNFSAAAVGQLINVASNFLLVPLFLRAWGVALYGEWLILFSTVAYLSTLDFGVQTAGLNRITTELAKGEDAVAKRTQDSAFFLNFVLATAGIAIVAVFVLVLNPQRLLPITLLGSRDVRLIIFALAVQVLWGVPGSFIRNLYRSIGRVAEAYWLFNVQAILIAVGTGAGLIAKWSPTSVAIYQAVPVVICSAYAVIALRNTKVAVRLRFPDPNELRRLVPAARDFGIIVAATAAVQQGLVIVIAIILGPIAVAVFSTTRTLLNVARQFTATLNSSIWSDVTALRARGSNEAVRRLIFSVTLLAMAFSAAYCGTCFLYGADIVSLWTGDRVIANGPLVRLLAAYTFLQVPWTVFAVVPAATNEHRRLAWMTCFASVVTFLLSFPLALQFGVAGVGAALLVGEAAFAYHFVLREAAVAIGFEYRRVARGMWLTALVMVCASLAAAVSASSIAPPPFAWLLSFATSLSVSGASAAILYVSSHGGRSFAPTAQ